MYDRLLDRLAELVTDDLLLRDLHLYPEEARAIRKLAPHILEGSTLTLPALWRPVAVPTAHRVIARRPALIRALEGVR